MPYVRFKGFDAILCTGDVCDTSFARKSDFKYLARKIKDPKAKFLNWYEVIPKEKAKRKLEESLKEGRKIMEKIASFGVPVYIVPGNSDIISEPDSKWKFMHQDFFGQMIGGFKNVKNIHNRSVNFGGFSIIGYGLSFGPEYPQEKGDKSIFSEKSLRRRMKSYLKWRGRMDRLFKKAKKPVIFLSHNVPYNKKIDRILSKESPRYGLHYGSLVAREMIDKYQPVVCIGGHMHEHYGKIQIGKTTCIAAGFGSDASTLLELEDGKIKSLKFLRPK